MEYKRGAKLDQDQQGHGEDVQGQGGGEIPRRATLQVRKHFLRRARENVKDLIGRLNFER